MPVKERIPHAEGLSLANEVIGHLNGTCDRIEIGGSLRRRRPDVGDIEIVLKPRIEMVENPNSLFGEKQPLNVQFSKVGQLLRDGVFEHRRDVNGHHACGERFQRLLYKGFALDLFCVLPSADQWGLQFVLRTGSAEFNKRLVLQKVQGGTILQSGQRIDGGALWDCGRKIETPEEIDLFNAVGLPWIEPEDRF